MNISNHAVTGAVIAIGVRQPVLALPLALASHFALDALPHFGYSQQGFNEAFKHRITYAQIGFSVMAGLLLVYLLRDQAAIVFLAAFLAVLPDFMWLYRYFGFERKGLEPPGGVITRFHKRIQWCERPWGIFIEVLFFGAMVAVLLRLL
jgi:hypothetical protein